MLNAAYARTILDLILRVHLAPFCTVTQTIETCTETDDKGINPSTIQLVSLLYAYNFSESHGNYQ